MGVHVSVRTLGLYPHNPMNEGHEESKIASDMCSISTSTTTMMTSSASKRSKMTESDTNVEA